jgi:hypothetical protein
MNASISSWLVKSCLPGANAGGHDFDDGIRKLRRDRWRLPVHLDRIEAGQRLRLERYERDQSAHASQAIQIVHKVPSSKVGSFENGSIG